jgi:hypothetical protein
MTSTDALMSRAAGCAGATEVEWFEKDMGSAVAKWMLERVDHQPITVDTQPLQGDGPSGDVTTAMFEAQTLLRRQMLTWKN